jgi:PPP family 3-phenylpropionic acid transporter
MTTTPIAAQPTTASPIYRLALLQFMTFASRGLVVPFINLYLVSVGFSGTQIGVLVGISALVQLLLTPLLNTLADRTARHRQLYYGLVGGNITALMGLGLSSNHWWLAGMIVGRDSTELPGAALLSQLTITWLDQQGRAIYGRLRAWGSLGFGLVTMVSGRIFALGGYHLLFVIGALINLAVIPLAHVLPSHTVPKQERKRVPRQMGFYILIASMFVYYIGMSAFNTFNFVYFKKELGTSNEMVGIIAAVAALSEVPMMLMVDRVLRRMNMLTALIIGILGMSALWITASLLTNNMLLIPLMMTRGIFFTLQNIGLTLLVARISHPSNAATNQSIIQVTMVGLTVLLTGPISGWLFDHVGGRILLQIAALMPLLAAMILLATRRYFVTTSQHPPLNPESAAARK